VLAPVAQLDRAPDFESGGQGFEPSPAHQLFWLSRESGVKYCFSNQS
jgi:hypothetical protein